MLLVRVDPRVLLVPSLLLVGGGQFWYAAMMNGTTDVLMFLWPAALIGLGSAGMWGPLATTAPRPAAAAGGRGVRHLQHHPHHRLGARLSPAIAALMQARLRPTWAARRARPGLGTGQLPGRDRRAVLVGDGSVDDAVGGRHGGRAGGDAVPAPQQSDIVARTAAEISCRIDVDLASAELGWTV